MVLSNLFTGDTHRPGPGYSASWSASGAADRGRVWAGLDHHSSRWSVALLRGLSLPVWAQGAPHSGRFRAHEVSRCGKCRKGRSRRGRTRTIPCTLARRIPVDLLLQVMLIYGLTCCMCRAQSHGYRRCRSSGERDGEWCVLHGEVTVFESRSVDV